MEKLILYFLFWESPTKAGQKVRYQAMVAYWGIIKAMQRSWPMGAYEQDRGGANSGNVSRATLVTFKEMY